VFDHFDGQGHAVLADVTYVGVVGQVGDGFGHAAGQLAVVFDDVFVPEDVQGGQGDGAADGVAGVAVAVQESPQGFVVVVEGVVDSVGGEHHGQRQVTGGQALGQAHEIRGDAGLFTGEHGAGAAKAHGDFVGNQVYAIAVAGFAQFGVVNRVVHAHAARALDPRLHPHTTEQAVRVRL